MNKWKIVYMEGQYPATIVLEATDFSYVVSTFLSSGCYNGYPVLSVSLVL